MPRKATEAAATKKPAAKKATTTRRTTKKVTEPILLNWDHVAERAYYIHLEEGGDATDNWLRAEREFVAV
jgi:Protein of unknown function (DUF2934)